MDRAALTWSQQSEPTPSPAAHPTNAPGRSRGELGLRLASALNWLWYIRCHLTEGRRWQEPLLAIGARGQNAIFEARFVEG